MQSEDRGNARECKRNTAGIHREYQADTDGLERDCLRNAKKRTERTHTGNTKGMQREYRGNKKGT